MEVEVPGMVGVVRVASRIVADDSLSISKMHSVGLVTISNPVSTSVQNNYTVRSVEFETNYNLIRLAIPDLDLCELSRWLANFKGSPVAA